MSSWCFVHAADLHLDTPLERIRRVDPVFHRRLLDASLDAFDELIELTVRRDAAFLVLAGDVYDGAARGLRAQLRVKAGAERLAAHGIALLMVHGNHDPLDGWDAVGAWPDNVTVFPADTPTSVEIVRDGRPIAVVAGVSYAEQAEHRNLALLFERSALDVPHVALLHANVGGNGEHAPYAPASLADLAAARFDYWALGHVHLRQTLARPDVDGFWAHYPGNLQGRSPKPSERGAKGASVVAVTDGVVGEPELVVLDRVRFASVPVAVDDDTTMDVVVEQLAAGADAAVADAAGRLVVLRGEVRGAGPVHHELAADGRTTELLDALTDRLGHADAVWVGCRDRTRPPVAAADVAAAVDVLDDVPVDVEQLTTPTLRALRGMVGGEALPDPDTLLAEARRLASSLLRESAR